MRQTRPLLSRINGSLMYDISQYACADLALCLSEKEHQSGGMCSNQGGKGLAYFTHGAA